MRRLILGSGRYIVLLAALIAARLAHTATLAPEMQKTVRAATFEVVLRKPDTDPLSYEKPLPLDLIPYVIRTDHYWSIGTAFAISPNTYVTAAHVLLATVGSEYGVPALRDGDGHVYPLDQVMKLSMHEDFAVFTLSGAPAATPLPTSAEHKIDDTVFAAGNALGEGVVVRDGLLTSETPEDQDGRWKWLRFSAAASPGNSGGPLLDALGRVIGIVEAKSPNENLNYALPITRVLEAPTQASFDLRYSVRLPFAREGQVATLKTQLLLPKRFADFAREYRELEQRTARRDRQMLESSLAGQLFPKGNSAKLLATVYDSPVPSFVQQDHDDAWDAIAPSNIVSQDLPGRGLVMTGDTLSVYVFRLRRPDGASDAAFYHNPAAFMDLLLKGLKLPRRVGAQAIRITSLGHAPQQRMLEDRYGRRWQITVWPLGYLDSEVVCYALPTPEGYVGMVQVSSASQLDMLDQYFGELTDALYVSYSGTLAQWQAFLSRGDLRPRALEHIQLEFDVKQGLRYRSPRVTLQLPADLASLTPQSELALHMTYIQDGERLSWDVGGIYLYKDPDQHTYVGLQRHVKPADESARALMETWNNMRTHGPGFNRIAGHDTEFKQYWIHDAVSAARAQDPGNDPNASVLYDVFYITQDSVYPRDLEETERRLIQATRILER
jgi:hypothetical protein